MSVLRMTAVSIASAFSLVSSFAHAQDYPNKPIRILAGGAGGGGDVAARLVAKGLSDGIGQSVIVDGRGGGADIVASIVKQSPNDGYTLLFGAGSFMLLPSMRSSAPYDPVKDFAPISLVLKSPNLLIVSPSLGVKNVKELIALAKARPGALNYGVGGIGGQVHLSLELFKSMAGIDIVQINYKGSSLAQNALLANEIQISGGVAFSVMPLIKSGRVISLGVTSAQPSALAPGIPTIASQGLPGYELASTLGVLAPAGTTDAIVNRLSQEISNYLKKPGVGEQFLKMGSEPVGSSPQAYAAEIKAEINRMGKVIKDAGIVEN